MKKTAKSRRRGRPLRFFRTFPFSALVFSCLLLLAGLILLLYPAEVIEKVPLWVGIGLLTACLCEGMLCYLRRDRALRMVSAAILCFLLLGAGVLVLAMPGTVFPFLFPLVGLLLMVYASFQLRAVLELRRHRSPLLLFCLLLALGGIGTAFFLIRTDGGNVTASLYVFCAGLLCGGLLGIFCSFLTYRKHCEEADEPTAEEEPPETTALTVREPEE